MNRRQFIQSLGVLVAGCLLPACGGSAAPAAAGRPRSIHVAYLAAADPGHNVPAERTAFTDRLGELGYQSGQTLRLEARDGNEREPDQLAALTKELLDTKPDVFVAAGDGAALAAQRATSAMPIVAVGSDLLSLGLVASQAKPGANLTGVSLLAATTVAKEMELLQQAFPDIDSAILFWTPGSAGVQFYERQLELAGQALGIRVRAVQVQSLDDVRRADQEMAAERPKALIQVPNGLKQTSDIGQLAVKYRLPSICGNRNAAMAGLTMSYGASPTSAMKRAADFVQKVAAGAKPGDLPVELPDKFEFIVNLKSAQAVGLTIPQSILAQATEIIQ